MEVLERKYSNFKKAYNALSDMIELDKEYKDFTVKNPKLLELHSSGIIQHFEIAYETAWKFLKQYLENIHGVIVASPKGVMQECYAARIISKDMFDELKELADVRNTTTHIYDQILAREVYTDILKHHKVLGKILEQVKFPQEN